MPDNATPPTIPETDAPVAEVEAPTPEDAIKAKAADLKKAIADAGASRHLSLAHTKIEEAIMWLEAHFKALI